MAEYFCEQALGDVAELPKGGDTAWDIVCGDTLNQSTQTRLLESSQRLDIIFTVNAVYDNRNKRKNLNEDESQQPLRKRMHQLPAPTRHPGMPAVDSEQ